MATFYGGEQLVNFIKIEGVAFGNTAIYTVPNGRYAKVFVNYAQGSGSQIKFNDAGYELQQQQRAILNNTYTSVGTSNEMTAGSSAVNFEIYLYSGETILVPSGSGSVIHSINVFEYNLP